MKHFKTMTIYALRDKDSTGTYRGEVSAPTYAEAATIAAREFYRRHRERRATVGASRATGEPSGSGCFRVTRRAGINCVSCDEQFHLVAVR